MKEADLYPPLKRFLEAQGYEVKGEVLDCDVLAVRGDEDPVVVELKLSLNLQLVLQAVDRLAVSDHVYIGVPEGNRTLKAHQRRIVRLLRMLGLGLLTIAPEHDRVAVVVDPGPYRGRRASKARKARLLGEFLHRVGDPTPGGAAKGGVRRMTAYRQRAIAIAAHLHDHGATKASIVAKSLSDTKARDILYRNVYGWFERVSVGVYDLSPRGREELPGWRD